MGKLLAVNQFKTFKQKDDIFSDETLLHISEWCKLFSQKFLESDIAESQLSREEAELFPAILSNFSELIYSYYLQKPGQWTKEAIHDVCSNLMPRKTLAETSFFMAIIPTLSCFINWLLAEKYLPDQKFTALLLETLAASKSTLMENHQNPAKWGLTKALIMGAKSKENLNDSENPLVKAADKLFTLDDTFEDLFSSSTSKPTPIFSIDQITKQLEGLDGTPLSKQAIESSLKQQKTITPILIDFIKAPLNTTPREFPISYYYALFLLAAFREETAFPFIIEALKTTPEEIDERISHFSLAYLHNIIASTYNGDLKAIQSIINDPTIESSFRAASIKSLTTLVREAVIEKNTIIEYFKTLFNDPLFLNSEFDMTYLAISSSDLSPTNLFYEIKKAFNENRIDKSIIDINWIDLLTKQDPEFFEENTFECYEFIRDPAYAIEDWLYFEEILYEVGDNILLNETAASSDHEKPFLSDPHFDYLYKKKNKTGRNEPCPCGSGKKFKKCCSNITPHQSESA